MEHPDQHRPDDTLSRRLWTPWRMTYIGGETKEAGCIFCNRLEGADDVAALILHRSANAFVIMNLFPYNTGHVMVVPVEHVATPEEAAAESLTGMSELLPPVLRALRRVLSCHGFNVGFNVGAVAGAGVAEHLHEHVVPRWTGDANFMPIIGSTMVIPELIPAAYAKIRAELQRELDGDAPVPLVVLDSARERVLLLPDGTLPLATLERGRPVWLAATYSLRAAGIEATIAGWAGENRAGPRADSGLTLIASAATGRGWRRLEETPSALTSWDQETLRRAIAQLAPAAHARHDPGQPG